MPLDNARDIVDPEGARKRQEELDEMIKKFLEKGGKIERIPAGMTGEQYRELKTGSVKKKKGRKTKSSI